MGRRKIEIERIDNKHNRFICFSKRRKGLFRKANELARRGFQIVVLVFSKTGNAFVYGSPSVEKVVERFLRNSYATNGAGSSNTAENLMKAPEDRKEETKEVSSGEDGTEESAQQQRKAEESEGSAQQKDMSRDETVLTSKTEVRAEKNDSMRNEMILASEDSLNSALTESEHFWWNSSVENLSWENLLQFKSALEELFNRVRRKADSLLVEQDFLAGFT